MSEKTIGMPKQAGGQNFGIDALRILSMMMVLMLHFLGFGGLLGAASGSPNYYVSWSLEAISIVAVNCFIMISGYLAVDSNFKVKRIIQIWLQVVFYSFGITLCCFLFFDIDVTKIQFIKSLLPVSTSAYWYVTAFFGLAFFMPVLNGGLKAIHGGYFSSLVVVLIVFFSFIPSMLNKDPFATKFGYTVIWFMVMYVIGYYIKSEKPFAKTKAPLFLLAYVFFTTITLLPKLMQIQPDGHWISTIVGEGQSLQYTFPSVLLGSIALFLFFSRVKIKGRVWTKLIAFFAPLSFAVYLIHMQPIIKIQFLTGSSTFLLNASPNVALCASIAIVIGLFVAMCLVDYIRSWIFKIMKINVLSEKAVAAVSKKLIRE